MSRRVGDHLRRLEFSVIRIRECRIFTLGTLLKVRKVLKKEEKINVRQKNDASEKKPTAIDLFCGCGGLTVGLKRGGFNVIGAVDNNETAVNTYEANHPKVHVWNRDIKKLTGADIIKKLKLKNRHVDLLAGCPPCQGFSRLRTHNGKKKIRDKRNVLLNEFLRLVEELKPKSVMMENVPGLKGKRCFSCFLSKMKKLGYHGEYDVLNAKDYGVPQRRRRLIYMAGLKGQVPFGNKSRKLKTVRDVIGSLDKSGASGDCVHDISEKRTEDVMKIIKAIPLDGGGRKSLPKKLVLKCHKDFGGFKDVYGRMAWDKESPTITGGCTNPSKGRFLHPQENRAITPREAALLQGFPRRYKFKTKNKDALSLMIGNALPPPFIAAHARSVFRVLRKHKQ